MNDYDFYLRHGSVGGGAWLGFRLAWRGLAGVEGLGARPYLHTRPWDEGAGKWGTWQWQVDVALFEGFVGLAGAPPADGRSAVQMRSDLRAYMDLPAIQLQDVDGGVHTVRLVGYSEQEIEAYDARNPNGGWVAQVSFVET